MKTLTANTDPELAHTFFANKMAFTTGPVELDNQLEANDDVHVVDVRDAEDYDKGHIPGAINLPQSQWADTTALRRDRTNVIYCYSATCHLAAKAAMKFAEQGFAVMEMDGGFEAWKKNDLAIER